MRDTVIEVDDLVCRHGRFEAVRGIDFDVARGELFALLGTNGAGKTTTMDTVAGHRSPGSGSVRVLGLRPDADRLRVRPRLGVLPQESGFSGDLTVLELARMWHALASRPCPVDEVLERLDLVGRRVTRVGQLSGGERRRLDLALAVMGNPEVLLLDEPTTGLDPQSRAQVWQVLRDLLADGTTILLTTHYLEEAEQLAHRLAIMHEGRVAVSGTLVDVLEREAGLISCTLPDGVPPLPRTSEAPEVTGNRLRLRTRALQDDLTALTLWAAEHRVQLARLRAHHASLSDVFHAIADRAETTR